MQPGDVLLEHRVEVRPAEAERAHPATACAVRVSRPVPELCVDPEGEVLPGDVGVGVVEAQARHQHPLMELHDHLEQAGCPGSGLEVADVGLDRAQGDRARLDTGAAEDLAETLQLGRVPDAGRGPVRLDRGGGARLEPGARPGTLHRQTLADGVRGSDALPLAVAGAAEPEQYGVHTVAVPLGVREPLEHEERGSLAHDEAVCACIERPGTGGRERADLAELHEAVDAHVAVDAAGDRRVEVTVREALHSRRRGCQRGGTGRVSGEVGAPEVEQVRDPAGQDVGELAGHGVLGDGGLVREEPLVPLLEDRRACLHGQRREGGRLPQVPGELGELHPQGRPVVLVPADRVPDDHRDPLRVHSPLRPAGVEQSRPGGRHRPLLADVELPGHLGRDRKSPLLRLPGVVADPAADAAVGLVRGGRVRVVVQLGVPTLGGYVADRVPTVSEVLPEGGRVRCVGHDRREADDGDGRVGVLVHGQS